MRVETRQIFRKALFSLAFFLVCCAILSFAGGILGYMLSEGATPEIRKSAGSALIASWGGRYTGGIMLIAAALTILGLATGKLGNRKMPSDREDRRKGPIRRQKHRT